MSFLTRRQPEAAPRRVPVGSSPRPGAPASAGGLPLPGPVAKPSGPVSTPTDAAAASAYLKATDSALLNAPPLTPEGTKVFTVLVADDAVATRQGLVELLEDSEDLLCVAAVGDAGAAVAEAARCQPNIALLDVLMPGGGGLAAAQGIREVSPRTRFLAYSAASDRASVVQMLRSGARGYLLKGAPAQDLLDGLRRCGEGATALSEGLSDHLITEMGELGQAERAYSDAAKARYERFMMLLEPGAIQPTYQPVVYLRTGALAGYEALTDFGRQPSANTEDIFREAHQVGLGIELELHTARVAVEGFAAQAARDQTTYLAVNASPGLLYRPALLEVLSQLPPERVVVEITEQRQFDSYDQLKETVFLVHERGMRVAVDDTGSGFAGLQRLVDVRPEIVKLDRALTSQIDTDPPRRALVAAMRHFADDMGITVVAEGIERQEQLVVLRDIGVDCGQGYLLGRPAPLR